MGRLGNINNYVAAQSDALKQKVNQQYDQQQQAKQQPVQQQPPATPVAQPIAAATNSNPMAGAEQVNFREKTLQNLDENDFKARQKELNASDKEYWSAKLKQNPESSYSILREYFASDETPEEKAKRERRDALGETFRNLGNVIGNAANLYYAHRGGTPIDLNTANEKHNERIRQLKEKQDAIQRQRDQMLVNAKINDIKSERAKALAEAKTKAESEENALKHQRELIKLQIENMYKLGQIDAQTKADLLEQAQKTKDAKELASINHQNSVKLKQTPTYRDTKDGEKVVDSVKANDGSIWTRSSKVTENEMRQIVDDRLDDPTPFTTKDEINGTEKFDLEAAFAYLAQNGQITSEELEQMGFKKGKTSSKKDGDFSYGKKESKGYSLK